MKHMDRIKIFGERNTGTNYFMKLLAENIDAVLLPGVVPNKRFWHNNEFNKNLYFAINFGKSLGWKHSLVKVDQIRKYRHLDETYFITLSKNPYSFLLSLFKRPYHYKDEKPGSFAEFLNSPWHLQRRDNMNRRYLDSPIELWNQKNAAYLDLKEAFPERCMNLRYENLLEDPNKVLSEVAERFQLKVNDNFRNITDSTKKDEKSFSDYQNYYLNEEWRAKLTPEDIEIINSRLDQRLMDVFDYKVLEAEEVGTK